MSRRIAALFVIGVLAVGLLGGAVLRVGPFAPPASVESSAGADQRWTSTIADGDFQFSLESRKSIFSTDESLDVLASLTYRGSRESVSIGATVWGPIEFFMKAPGATLLPYGPGGCSELDLARGVPLTEPLMDLQGVAHPFRVAHGLHDVGAFASFRMGGCSGGEQSLRTSIVVAVVDGPDDIPIFTDVAGEVTACLLMRGGGRLTRSATGLGVVDSDGHLRDVVWPKGYSARSTAAGAVLVGRDGRSIAREGEVVLFDAITPEHGPIWPCGEVQIGT